MVTCRASGVELRVEPSAIEDVSQGDEPDAQKWEIEIGVQIIFRCFLPALYKGS